MKIITAENGKKTVKISKSEWETIGKKHGWMNIKIAGTSEYPDIAFYKGKIFANCPSCQEPFVSNSICQSDLDGKPVKCKCGNIFVRTVPQHPQHPQHP